MITTEFFGTLAEAEAFQPCGIVWKEVYGLDRPGTVQKYRDELSDALAHERNIDGCRAVVKMWR